MEFTIIAFGIARDILGSKKVQCQLDEPHTVQHLLQSLQNTYPQIEDLASIKVAVNSEYALLDQTIRPSDEIVLIPPVSGG